MQSVICLLAIACTSVGFDDWLPPENANPQAILQEARADTRAKRHETALAKHVWFHENALSIDPTFYGVRLSFALSDWAELAKEYPPALTKMKEFRDQAKKQVLEEQDVRASFHDMLAFNQRLDEQSDTKNFFEILDQEHPQTAKQVFDMAKSSLVHAKAYSLFAKYVAPKDDLASMLKAYEQHKKLAADSDFGADHFEFANKQFANDVTTLVAILVVTDRKNEAEDVAKSARAEWDDSSFHEGLDKALEGVVPDPWP